MRKPPRIGVARRFLARMLIAPFLKNLREVRLDIRRRFT